MGSEFCSRKPHYDITMSKRTRKPTLNLTNNQESANSVKINQVVNDVCSDESNNNNNDVRKKSLKQLIEGGRPRGTSLGEHFTAEEKQQLQVVATAENGGGSNGVKFKHMVSRYTKVLSQIIKLKRDAGKPHFRLKVHF